MAIEDKIIIEEGSKAILKSIEHLIPVNDLTLIILKGHLIVEEEINELLDLILPNPDALSKGRFEFYQKLCILKAVCSPGLKWHWQTIEQLSKMRNQLAHNLESKGLNGMVKDFLNKVDSEIKKSKAWENGTDVDRLKLAIASVHGRLVGMKCLRKK